MIIIFTKVVNQIRRNPELLTSQIAEYGFKILVLSLPGFYDESNIFNVFYMLFVLNRKFAGIA